ncbi:MAG: hypothetical protein E6L03_03385 [Thaumarchaeota archaeon]|nr:MAG: hypothetical protein E6L03_03385 [Nitrososphaerota archaeon]
MTYGKTLSGINSKYFLKSTIASLLLLSFIHIYVSITTIDFNSTIFEFLHIITILVLIIIFLSFLLKGIVPLATSCVGIVLLYGSIAIPYIESNSQGAFYYKASIGNLSFEAINHGSHGYFLLGIAMVVFSMIIAYKPSILYTKNRPISAENIWDKYPKWNENKRRIAHWIAISHERHRKISSLAIRIHTRLYLRHDLSSPHLFICTREFKNFKGIRNRQDYWSIKVWLFHLNK